MVSKQTPSLRYCCLSKNPPSNCVNVDCFALLASNVPVFDKSAETAMRQPSTNYLYKSIIVLLSIKINTSTSTAAGVSLN